MSQMSFEQIMDDLAGMLRSFGGREYGGQITPETRFAADLGLASIDAVVLGEEIEVHYERKLPFHEFLAELGRQGAYDIEVGALARFLQKHLNQPAEPAA